MDLKELTYIVTIADEGSISRAAEKLFMAQSSLSQFLTHYEAELGATLFYRTSRGVRPTDSGLAFLARARQMLGTFRRARNELSDIAGLSEGEIELGVSTFRGSYLMPKVLKRFHAIYPNIHVHITERNSVELESLILDGALDIALVAIPTARLTRNHLDFLMREEIVLIAAKDHPVMELVHPPKPGETKPWVHIEDTLPFEYILGPADTILGRTARREFRRRGLEPIARNTDFTAEFAAAMAREGIGLALSYLSCRVDNPNVEYIRFGEKGTFLDLALTYPSGEYRSRATIALAELMHEMYGA